MSTLERSLVRFIELTLPTALADNVAGDLIEEAAELRSREPGWKTELWLIRHSTVCAFHAVRLRLRSAEALECAAATALFIGAPFSTALALRRYILTQVPFRHDATFTDQYVVALALLLLGLAAAEGTLLAAPGRRRWLPVLLTTSCVWLVGGAELPALQLGLLTAAAFSGVTIATLKTGGKA